MPHGPPTGHCPGPAEGVTASPDPQLIFLPHQCQFASDTPETVLLIKPNSRTIKIHSHAENANDPKHFWKAIKSIFSTKGGDGSSTLQAMNLEDGIKTDTTKIANGFGFFFSNIATELKKSLNRLGNHIWQKVVSHDLQALYVFISNKLTQGQFLKI